MIPRYLLFRGPGNRLVAISQEPVGGTWFVKSGEQGKKLKSATVPVSKHSTLESVKSSYISDSYQLIHSGKIDALGNPTEKESSVVFWESSGIDINTFRDLLRRYAGEMQQLGVGFNFTDDMSGTRVQFGQVTFGYSLAASPGCISNDGNGGGTLNPSSSADLLCLVGLLSRSLSISIADAKGKPLNGAQLLSRCGSSVSDEMSAFLKLHGLSSLASTLRNLNVRQVRF